MALRKFYIPILGLFLGIIVYIYLIHVSWTFGVNSDWASALLEARSMAHGNILLHGWTTPPDSFWSTYLLLAAVWEYIGGFSTTLLHTIPVFVYLLMVVVAGWSSVTGTLKNKPAVAAIAITPIVLGSKYLLDLGVLGPLHILTYALSLGAFALVFRGPRWALVIASFLLSMASIGDPYTVWVGLLPLFLVGSFSAFRQKDVRLFARWAIVSLGPYLASKAAMLLLRHLGAFAASPQTMQFASFESMGNNLSMFTQGLLDVSGAFFFGHKIDLPNMLRLFRLAYLFMVFWSVWKSLCRLWRSGCADISSVLSASFVIIIFAYTFSNLATALATMRYLVPAYIFGSVVLSRELYAPLFSFRYRYTSIAALAILMAYPSISQFKQPVQVNPARKLASWVESRGLRYGYGSYWDASITTVLSNGKVKIRPVISGDGRIAPFHWLSSSSWYYTHQAMFLVYSPDHWGGVDLSTSEKTFGVPTSINRVGSYTVLVWARPLPKL